MKSKICFSRDGKPRSSYTSKRDADLEVIARSDHYGILLASYNCKRCNYWHHTTIKHYTPFCKCNSCLDSKGYYKDLYFCKKHAKRRARLLFKKRNIYLKVYRCPKNKGWHLTKK